MDGRHRRARPRDITGGRRKTRHGRFVSVFVINRGARRSKTPIDRHRDAAPIFRGFGLLSVYELGLAPETETGQGGRTSVERVTFEPGPPIGAEIGGDSVPSRWRFLTVEGAGRPPRKCIGPGLQTRITANGAAMGLDPRLSECSCQIAVNQIEPGLQRAALHRGIRSIALINSQ